jgi:hypothetical protein
LVIAAAELPLVVVMMELSASVVAAIKVDGIAMVVKEVVAVVVMSPNWKFQSLPCQTQCPACAIGHDSQRSFQVSIHHSLQSIPTCFYGGQGNNRFLCQNRVLIVCMTRDQLFHTYGQKCSQITKCHNIGYNYYIHNVFND